MTKVTCSARKSLWLAYLCLGVALAPLPTSGYAADALTETVDAQKAIASDSSKSQKQIDALADQTGALVNEYREIIRQTDVLTSYNDQNERIVASQSDELTSLERQIDELEQTRTEIVPLMLKMIESLGRFVEADLPFKLDERRIRVAALTELMDRSDVATSEKYRRILEAYQTEYEYGNTIEAFKASLGEGDDMKTYDFLRVGRVALVYQSPDGEETGQWNKHTRQWEALDESYRAPVSQAIRIARKQAPPGLIRVPVLAGADAS